MAKLTISDAARVAGVARSTLHRAIKQGRLSVDADGRIDTAELLRAGYTLQRSVRQEKPEALQDATPRSSVAQQSRQPAPIPETSVLTQERDLLRLERDLLRRELDAAHAREQAAREREALLLHMLEQVQQQNQRLLDVPRQISIPSVPSTTSDASVPRGEMRRRIMALLREHPDGLFPAQARHLLGSDKDLGSTMRAMARDGLLTRVEIGRYGVSG